MFPKIYAATFSTVFISDEKNVNKLRELGAKYVLKELETIQFNSAPVHELKSIKDAPKEWTGGCIIWGEEDLNDESLRKRLIGRELTLEEYFHIKKNPKKWEEETKAFLRRSELQQKIKKMESDLDNLRSELDSI